MDFRVSSLGVGLGVGVGLDVGVGLGGHLAFLSLDVEKFNEPEQKSCRLSGHLKKSETCLTTFEAILWPACVCW